MRACPNCQTTNPRYRAVCYECSYILSGDTFERQLMLGVLNELRELNDKRRASYDELRTEDPIEAIKRAYEAGDISEAELEARLGEVLT